MLDANGVQLQGGSSLQREYGQLKMEDRYSRNGSGDRDHAPANLSRDILR